MMTADEIEMSPPSAPAPAPASAPAVHISEERPSFFQSALCTRIYLFTALAIFVLLLGVPLGLAGGSELLEEHRATDHSSTHPHPRQAFIFRHCVRTAASEVKHGVAALGTSPSNYTSVPLPAWGVPTYHCTAGGTELVERTGADLRSRFVPDAASVAVFADGGITNARCQTSARAMLRGMGRDEDSLTIDAAVFDTLDPDNNSVPLCTQRFTDADELAAVRARLDTVAQPSATSTAIQLFAKFLGPLVSSWTQGAGLFTLDENGTLIGGIRAFKLFSQIIFYAFASGIQQPGLLQQPTVNELYQLIAWQHYCRSIGDMGPEKAVANLALLHRVLGALSDGSEDAADASFFWGHDGNLDGFAMLLNTSWAAPPYLGGESYVPTPPGSGLRFELDQATGSLDVSFVYPVYTQAGSGPAMVNSSGILEQTPIMSTTLTALRERVMRVMEGIPGALECYGRVAMKG